MSARILAKEYRASRWKSQPFTSSNAQIWLPPTVMLSTVTVTSPQVSLRPTFWVRLSIIRDWDSVIGPPVSSAHFCSNHPRRVGAATARAVPASATTSAAAMRTVLGMRRFAVAVGSCFVISMTSFRSCSEA